jgi:cytoskeleton protein RodZ
VALADHKQDASSVSGFGDYLKREREMRGVPLDEISAATRISIRFLQAIENEELSKLPGGIFTRSFVRTYARYLGLDEEQVLSDCLLSGHPKSSEVDIRKITANRPSPDTAASRTRWIAFFVAVGLLIVGYALFKYSRRAMEQSNTQVNNPPVTAPAAQGVSNATAPNLTAPGQAPAAEAPAPPLAGTASPTGATAPAAVKAPPKETQAGSSTQQTEQPETAAPVSGNELTLQIAATDRSWVAIDVDGKTVIQRVLEPNEVRNLKAHESFDITTGNAQGVVLTLNGETLKPLGHKGEVKSIHLTRSDIKHSAPER